MSGWVKVHNSIQYNEALCINCSECLKCPTQAISLNPLYIEPDACVDCAVCVLACSPRAIEEQPVIAGPKTPIVWGWTDNYKDYTHTYKEAPDSEPITKTFRLRQLKTIKGGTLQASRYDSYAKPPTSFSDFCYYVESNEYSEEYQSAVFKWKHIATGVLYDPSSLDYSSFRREDYEYVEISPGGVQRKLQPQVLGMTAPSLSGNNEVGLSSKWFRYEVSPNSLGPWINENANLTFINNSNLIGDSNCIAIFQTATSNRYSSTTILKDSSFLFVNKASTSSSFYLWDSSLSVGISTNSNVKTLLVCADVKNFFEAKKKFGSYYYALASMGESFIRRVKGFHSFSDTEFGKIKGKRSYIEEAYSVDRSNSTILGSIRRAKGILVDRPIRAEKLSSVSSAFVTLSDKVTDPTLGLIVTASESKVVSVPIHGVIGSEATSLEESLLYYGHFNYASPFYYTASFHTSIRALKKLYMIETSFANPNSILSLAVTNSDSNSFVRDLIVGSCGYLNSPVLTNTPNKNFRFIDSRDEVRTFAQRRRFGFNIGSDIRGLVNSYKAKCLYKRIASNITYTPTDFNNTTYDNDEDKKAWEESSYIEITNTSKTIQTLDGVDITVRQIKALKDFTTCKYDVKAGDLGGWVNERVCIDTRDKVWLDEKSYVLPSAFLGGELLFLNTQITSTNVALEWEVLKVFCLARRLRLDNTRIEEKASSLVRNLLACRYGGHTLNFISEVRLQRSTLTFDGDWGNVIIGFDNFFAHKVDKIYEPISLNSTEFSNCPNFFIKNSALWIQNKLYFKGKLIEYIYNKNNKVLINVASNIEWES